MSVSAEAPARADRLALIRLHAIGKVSDDLVQRAEKLCHDYFAGADSMPHSPFKNVMAVSTAPGSGLKVVQNFILYQLGRSSEASRVWKRQAGNKYFAQAVVEALDRVKDLAERVAADVKSISGHEPSDEERRQTHLQLARLLLGYLARSHTALAVDGRKKRGS